MESILNLIDEGNFISLLLLIGVVAFVGQKMVEFYSKSFLASSLCFASQDLRCESCATRLRSIW